MRDTEQEPRRHPAGSARFALPAVVVIGAAALGFAALASTRAGTSLDTGVLASTVGGHRVTKARLSGGFRHAPCRQSAAQNELVPGLICQGPAPDAWPESATMEELARRAQTMSTRVTAGGRHHFTGAWKLLWGDADAAISELREAARLQPANAVVLSDLGAALLARAHRDPASLVDACEAIDSALALDASLAEARFNQALALESLQLRNDAIEAWRSYLTVDRRSPWADEAREHLDQLTRPAPTWSVIARDLRSALDRKNSDVLRGMAGQFPMQVRGEARARIHEWARRRMAGDAAADSVLSDALALGVALHQATGDAMWAQQAELIQSAGGDETRLGNLASGLVAIEQGEAYYDRFVFDSAVTLFRRARSHLVRAGSPYSEWADYDLAKVDVQRHDYRTAVTRLRRVIDSAPADWRLLGALAVRTLGFVDYIRADFDAAMAAFTSVTDGARQLGEPVLELRARTDVARIAATLRGENEAWRQLYQAFRALERYPDRPAEAQTVFAAAAELASTRSAELALRFQRSSARLTASDRRPESAINAITREARLLTRAGRNTEALERLRSLDAHLDQVANDSIAREMRANAALIHAEAWLRQRPDSSIVLLNEVVALYRRTNYLQPLARTQLVLANAYARAGVPDSARLVFERALAETERQRSRIENFDERAQFLDRGRPVIDTVLSFLLQQQDTLGALDFLERMRARVLLERIQGDPSGRTSPQPTEMLRQRFAPGTNVISYAVLDGELVTWLIRRSGTRMFRTPLPADVAAQVERLRALIGSRPQEDETRTILERLYQVLVAPLDSALEPQARLVFVPDKWLHDVPFSALFDARRERFLVELHEVVVAPSVQLFGESAARYRALKTVAAPLVLAMGDPAFDRRTYALPRLPGAREEAAHVARQYRHATLLTDTAATRDAFLAMAPRSGIIHFAGHGVVRPDAPLLSHLVLAPDPAGRSPGALYATDLFALKLPRTRLAILSGCQTASGRLSYTEGASSLARAFFAAGVPAVIASLWAVEDAGTGEFFEVVHRAVGAGLDPAAALRRAQLEWIARPAGGWAQLGVWAAFELFGSTGGLVDRDDRVES